MNDIPAISVIVPVYKVENYIHTCVESILRQTFADWEMILVDDGSPDRCPDICDGYSRADSRIKVIHKRNAGLGYARNSGLDAASGKYVCFLDSDDYLASNTFELCYRIAEKEEADQVRYMFGRFLDRDGVNINPLSTDAPYKIGIGRDGVEPILDIVSPLISERKFFAPTTASSCTALYRRELIEANAIRFHSERELMSEDYIFSIDFGMVCRKIVYTPYQFYYYRHNPASLSSVPRLDRFDRAVHFAEFLAEKMKGYGYENPEIYAMGYAIGEMRSSNLRAFFAKIPYRQKKAIFMKTLQHGYVGEIRRHYPLDRLPMMQRVAFFLHTNRLFWLSYFVTKVRMIWKK